MSSIDSPLTSSVVIVSSTTPASPGMYPTGPTGLSIDSTGSVEPSGGTAAAVYSSYSGAGLRNYGKIYGATGSVSSSAPATEPSVGGAGVLFTAEGFVLNDYGIIRGGMGSPAAAGIGVDFTHGNGAGLNNRGKIYGGYAGGPTVSTGLTGFNGGAGVSFTGYGQIVNVAQIYGGGSHTGYGGAGVDTAGGFVTNESGAKIQGGFGSHTQSPGNGGDGVDISGVDATFANAGMVLGGSGYAGHHGGIGVDMSGGAGSTSNSNSGTILGGNGYSSATGGAGVELSGSVTKLTNTGHITGGNGYLVAQDAGTGNGGAAVYLDGGTLTNSGTLTGGTANPDAVNVRGIMGDAVSFAPSIDSTLVLQNGSKLIGDIGGFATGDIIKVSGTVTETADARTTATAVSTPDGTLYFTGNFTGEHFVQTALGGGVTEITLACYLRGTAIRTASGVRPIEQLSVGDRVLTASGELRPVRWLGYRALDCSRHPEPSTVWPICIQAGALADQLPARDLWLSPGHSIAMGGALIQADQLVNGASIVQVPRARLEYWHLELDSHDLVLAEGLAAESYLDTGNRSAFANGGECRELFPNFKPKHWTETCLPLVLDGPVLEHAKAAVLARAGELGYALTGEHEAHLLADAVRVEAVRLGDACLGFFVPEGAVHVELRCRTFVPAHVQADNGDTRELGLCIRRLQLDGRDIAIESDAQFTRGWHPLEQGAGQQWRWTHARVPLPPATRLVVIDLGGRGRYWSAPRAARIARVA